VDITERKLLERERDNLLECERFARGEAEKALRIKDDFLATVSHELRNPLGALMGWTRLLARGRVDVAKAVDIIDKSASALSQIVSDLLDMSRIVSGKTQLQPEPTEIVALIGNVLDGVRLAAETKGITLNASLDPQLRPITCDPNRMQQIIHNLLSNAVKFTPEGGKVNTRVEQSGNCVEISVADNGQGIAPEFLPYVFHQFRQADQSNSRHHGGLGLGLAIVKHLVELHGGTIRAQSQGLGQGATFTVSLPYYPAPLRRVMDDIVAAGDLDVAVLEGDLTMLRGRRILIVDDDENNCELVARVVEESGATARFATSGEQGLILLAEFQPDLVISDIGMPGMNGFEFVRRIKANGGGGGASLPCLALTAYARLEDRDEALRMGFDEYLSKPFNSVQLAQVLNRLWQQPARE
jgi:CheY-like chemotaxis protein/nitrogen-specific signal transduction histidine kinase